MSDLKIITTDNLHQEILNFINNNEVTINEYEHMKELILKMIREKYVFSMDRDRLRDAMEDLTYMLCPEDEVNQDRVSRGLEYDDDSSSEEEEDENEMMNLMKAMGMNLPNMNMPIPTPEPQEDSQVDNKEDSQVDNKEDSQVDNKEEIVD